MRSPATSLQSSRWRIPFSAFVGACVFFFVFVGFARTYYLRPLSGLPRLEPLLHVHGLLMTGWFVLFFVQIALVKSRHLNIHRRMGWFGMGLTINIVLLATYLAIRSAAHDLAMPPAGGPPAIEFMEILLTDLILFAGFVTLGIVYRRNRSYHMRFMLLACLSMSGPGIFRIPLRSLPVMSALAGGGPYGLFGLDLLLLYGCIVVDTVKNRSLHPAFLLGGIPLVLIDTPLFGAAAGSHWGLEVGRWLVSFYK